MDAKLTVTAASFEAAYKKFEQAEVVEFVASWCPHCHHMNTLIDKLAKNYRDKVAFLVVDVEQAPVVARKFGVSGVPSFVFVKEGQVVHRMAGVFAEADLRKHLDTLL